MKYLIIILLITACATPRIPTKCLEKRIRVNEKYFRKIDGINIAQEGNSKPYFIMTFKTMKENNSRYDSLVEYVNCLEKN